MEKNRQSINPFSFHGYLLVRAATATTTTTVPAIFLHQQTIKLFISYNNTKSICLSSRPCGFPRPHIFYNIKKIVHNPHEQLARTDASSDLAIFSMCESTWRIHENISDWHPWPIMPKGEDIAKNWMKILWGTKNRRFSSSLFEWWLTSTGFGYYSDSVLVNTMYLYSVRPNESHHKLIMFERKK